MGAGIASAFLAARSSVVVVEADNARAAGARRAIESSLERAGERGHLADPLGAAARLQTTADRTELRGAQLVIEAVPEDQVLKSGVLAAIEPLLDTGAVLATNTSSISVDALAAALARPARFLGMHFFNPVPASALVEVVRGSATAPSTVEEARAWIARIDKEAIVVADSPGFASSRLGVAIGLEAIRMVEESVAAPEDIDAAMVLGYRFPMGPLRLTDLVGLDVRLGIAEYLHRTLGERFAPPQLLRDKVARGELGKKSGKGFYEWQ